jgi:hypothetical protein
MHLHAPMKDYLNASTARHQSLDHLHGKINVHLHAQTTHFSTTTAQTALHAHCVQTAHSPAANAQLQKTPDAPDAVQYHFQLARLNGQGCVVSCAWMNMYGTAKTASMIQM